ncbi:hypothetical protein LG315_11725 [Microbacterium marinum]|uniref:hypothetical protein n=1 Tax=Microbacterium marinum TaxID=421115 RepID=UPI00384C1D92
MTRRQTLTIASILLMSSCAGLLAAGVASALYVLGAAGGTAALVVVLVGGVVAMLTGITGVWMHRGRVIVPVFATIGYLTVGVTLTVSAAGTLQSAAEGGFVNIGASFLLLVGTAIIFTSIALAVMLTVFVARDRRRLPFTDPALTRGGGTIRT